MQDIPLQDILLVKKKPVNLLIQCTSGHQYSFSLKRAVIGNTVRLRVRYILTSNQSDLNEFNSLFDFRSFVHKKALVTENIDTLFRGGLLRVLLLTAFTLALITIAIMLSRLRNYYIERRLKIRTLSITNKTKN